MWRRSLIYALARLYPYEADASEELREALAFIDSEFDAETIVRAGYGGGLVAFFPVIPLMVLPIPTAAAILIPAALSIATIHAIHTAPKLLMAFAQTRALGETPNLIGLAVLRMQIEPATEGAVKFAAESGRGPLANSLESHVQASLGRPTTGLLTFADEWSERFPALQRSANLLASAEDAPAAERGRALDRSLSAILDGTRNQMAEYTNAIQGPTTALYAFGVMLPLALVALVPAVGLAGFSVSMWFFVILYNLLLPAVLVAASFWLLSRRPVAFPPPDITRNHPDVPANRISSVLWGAGAGAVAFALTSLYGPAYLAPISAVGVGGGVLLVVYYRPILLVRDYVKDVEENLVDALYLVGRLVAEDEAVESALVEAAENVPGATGDVFEHASGLQRRLHVGVNEAFYGRHGALKDIPSRRARSTANLIAIASKEGSPAGRAIVSMADHLEELQDVEAETRRSLSSITGTLNNTAAIFGPMVAGATVGLASGMATRGIEAISTAVQLPTDQLGIIIGLYVILLCGILIPLSVSLEYGFDRALVGYRIGTSLMSAVPIYVMTITILAVIL